MEDMINSPKHYTAYSMTVEPIIICKYLSFCLGNVVKYVIRAGLKGGPEKQIQDYKKALYYAQMGYGNPIFSEAKFAFSVVKSAFPKEKELILQALMDEDYLSLITKLDEKINSLKGNINETE